jgi:hypothetical protein
LIGLFVIRQVGSLISHGFTFSIETERDIIMFVL